MIHDPAEVVAADIGAHFKVFMHRQCGKDIVFLWHKGNAMTGQLLGSDAGDVFTIEMDGPLRYVQHAENGFERCGFASAVWPHNDADLARFQAQIDALENAHGAVSGVKIPDV